MRLLQAACALSFLLPAVGCALDADEAVDDGDDGKADGVTNPNCAPDRIKLSHGALVDAVVRGWDVVDPVRAKNLGRTDDDGIIATDLPPGQSIVYAYDANFPPDLSRTWYVVRDSCDPSVQAYTANQVGFSFVWSDGTPAYGLEVLVPGSDVVIGTTDNFGHLTIYMAAQKMLVAVYDSFEVYLDGSDPSGPRHEVVLQAPL